MTDIRQTLIDKAKAMGWKVTQEQAGQFQTYMFSKAGAAQSLATGLGHHPQLRDACAQHSCSRPSQAANIVTRRSSQAS